MRREVTVGVLSGLITAALLAMFGAVTHLFEHEPLAERIISYCLLAAYVGGGLFTLGIFLALCGVAIGTFGSSSRSTAMVDILMTFYEWCLFTGLILGLGGFFAAVVCHFITS